VPTASAIVVGVLGAAAAWTLKPEPRQPIVRFAFTLPTPQIGARRLVAVSPDGTLIAYVADRRLYVRPIGDLRSVPLGVTDAQDGVNLPAFSPDGKSLAFYALGDNSIKRIAVAGGSAVPLCEVSPPFGLSWSPEGIVFGQISSEKGLVMRVSASGGTPEVLVRLQSNELIEGPQLLPGGEHVLLTVALNTRVGSDRWDKAQIVVQSIKSGARKVIVDGGSDARYLTTGHIVYAVGGTVYAVPFDLRTLKTTGVAFPVLEGVRRAFVGATGIADFAVSANGTLAYAPGPAGLAGGAGLALLDWAGELSPLKLPLGAYAAPRVSPDGKRIALEANDGRETFVGVYERDGSAGLRRITIGGSANSPVWSPDGSRVAFQSSREGDAAIFTQTADGSGTPARLTRPQPGESHVPQSWFGDVLLFDVVKHGQTALWQLSLNNRSATPFGSVRSSSETGATFSPDGHWVAYAVSDEHTTSLAVQPYPATSVTYVLVKPRGSTPHHPVWAPDGSALIYLASPGVVERVAVTRSPAFSFGNPEPRARGFQGAPPGTRRLYDITPDGHILGLVASAQLSGAPAQEQIVVVLNWFTELQQRVPTR
jgi:Tol biopolymer transport system component